ncbi:DUF2382 domain-containing protein [Streptomyces sp. NPDC048512]|uniref:DUF2382 domain-containing protein n=1 Tax=Streptomyces sp. NPDC048512 TaxID=3365563 RepID=UPI00371B657E
MVREPVTGADTDDDALSGPEITEAEHEVTLHAERPVVETRVEPVERVRLETDEVIEEETVTGTGAQGAHRGRLGRRRGRPTAVSDPAWE